MSLAVQLLIDIGCGKGLGSVTVFGTAFFSPAVAKLVRLWIGLTHIRLKVPPIRQAMSVRGERGTC